jgi:hypothetical protein
MIALAARKEFLEKNRAALYDFFEDLVRALHWYLDPTRREEAIGVVAGFAKEARETFYDYLFTERNYYRDPDTRPNLDAFQRNRDTQQQLGSCRGLSTSAPAPTSPSSRKWQSVCVERIRREGRGVGAGAVRAALGQNPNTQSGLLLEVERIAATPKSFTAPRKDPPIP